MLRSRRRHISRRSVSTSRTSRSRASRQRLAQSPATRVRSAAPALKNILSQLTGLASASPWRKQRDKRGAARKPKPLRIEGLERREMLTVEHADIDVYYAGITGSRIGPEVQGNVVSLNTPAPLFKVAESLFSTDNAVASHVYDIQFSIESDMVLNVDYAIYAYDDISSGRPGTGINSLNTSFNTQNSRGLFEIEFLRELKPNEDRYVRVTLLDTGDYDVPGSSGYKAEETYESLLIPGDLQHNLATRTTYFRGTSTINQVAPCVDCEGQCQAPGDTKALVNEAAGAAVVKHMLGGLTAGDNSDPSASPNGVLSYNSASLTSPILRGFDNLPLELYTVDSAVRRGPPTKVEVTASYYQLNSSDVYEQVLGTSTTSFFSTDYDGAMLGGYSGVQYALKPDASSLSTGVYQWRMSVKYYFADDYSYDRGSVIQGYQLILNDSDSVFGKGWQFSEAPNLTLQNGAKTVTLRSGQNAHVFFQSGSSSYTNGVGLDHSVGALVKLEGNTTNGFDYFDKNGTQWKYYANGRIFKSIDRNGNTTEYHYANGGADQLEYILYPNGRRTIFEYDGGYVSRIIQGALANGTGGTSTSFFIDNGLLLSITGEDADGENYGLPAPVTEFSYVESSALVEEVKRHIVSPLTPTETTYEETNYTYHAPSGTVSAVEHTSGSCGCGAATMEFTAAQRWGAADPTILNGSDPQGSATNPAPLRAIGAPQGAKSEQISSTEWRDSAFTIDGFNQIASQTVSPGTAAEATTRYHRNADGLIRRVIEADPDGAGPLSSPITTYNYDPSGNLNLTSISLPNGQTQAWTYGTHNQVTSYTDELGRETRYQLDSRGNVERMQQVIGTPDTFELQGDDVFTQFFYTDAPTSQPPGARLPGGLITKIIDPLNHETKYQYYRSGDSSSAPGAGSVDANLLGLLEKVTFAVSTTDQAEALFGYDDHRRLTSQTDELTRTTAYAYDAQNRVISITEPDSDLTDSLEAPVTTFSYDTLGRLARQVDPDPDGAADPRDAHWTEYHYSNNDRTLTVVESPREDGASEIETKYEHDMLGRLLKVTDPLDNVTEYTYTNLDQVATVKLPEASSGAPRPVYTYEYDALGRLTRSLAPAPPVNTQPAVGAAIGTSNTLSVTTAAATLEVPIFNLQNGAIDLFTDAEDAASTLRYEIVANDNAALFDSIRIENSTPGGLDRLSYRKVVFDFAGSTAGSAEITIRATDRGGLYRDRTFTVSRTALGSPQLVNTTTSGLQTNAVVANLADGRYVVVWEGAGATDSDGIYFRIFKADGTPDSVETRINQTTTGHQGSPSVVSDGGGGFVVVWSDHSQSTSRVLSRGVNSNGNLNTFIKTIYTNSDNADTTPVIALPDPNFSEGPAKYAVAWRGTQSDGTSAIFTARVLNTSTSTVTPTQVNTTPTGNQQRPTIAAIDAGGYIIAWDGQGADDASGIFARRYRFDDAPYTEVRLNVDPSDVFNHSYAVTSDGGFVVTWMLSASGYSAIRARQFAPDGNPTGSEIVVGGESVSPPHVTRFDNGDFLITYRDDNTDNVMVRRYRQDGAAYASQYSIASAATGVARAAARADGSALVVYDGSNGTDADGVFVTQVAAPDTSPSAGGAFRVLGIEPGSGASGGAASGGTAQGRVDQVLVNFSDAVDDDTLTTDDIISFHRWDGVTETAITITGIVAISRTQIALRFGAQTTAGEYRLVLGSNITRAAGAAVKLDQNRNGTAEESGDKFSGSFYLAAAAPTTAAETNYEYDALGRTTKTIDSAGAVTEYAYTQSGEDRLITVSERLSAAGAVYRQTVYRYDALDRLIRVTLPDTEDTSEPPKIEYAYDKASNLLRVTDSRSAKTDYRYDARNRLIRRFDANATSFNSVGLDGETPQGGVTEYTYNVASELVSVLDTRGGLTQYAYDGLGRLKTLTQPDPDGSAGNQPLPSPVTHFKYDNAGYLVRRTDPEFVARDGTISPVTDYEYDTQGNLRRVLETAPRTSDDRPVWEYQYDDAGQLVREIDPLAATTDYEYDGLGQLVTITEPEPVDWAGNYGAVTQFRYDIRGNLVTQLDTLGAPTQFAYDAAGRLTARTNALGGTSGTQFDSLGRVTADIDELGRVTRYLYTELDQLATLREADPDGPAASGIGALSEPVTSYHYDAAGNLTSVVDPRSHTTTYDYDALGRLIEITQPADNHNQQPVWQYQYNAAGDLTGAIDPEGRVTGFQVDALGRRIRLIAPDPTTLGGSGGPVTEYAYDSSGRLTTVKAPDADGAAGNYHAATTTYLYDNLGRLARQTLPNKSTGAATGGAVTNYTRDLLGRLESAQTTAASGQILTSTYAYDRLGRLSDISEPGQAARQFWYDALGRVEWSGEHDQWSSYDYDSLGQEVRRQDPRLATTTQMFDAAGQLTSVTDPARNTTRWEYDRLGRVTRETDPKQKDRTYGYDAAGNLTSQTDRLGQTRLFTYDNLNRVQYEDWLNSSAAVTRTLSWDYDLSGLLINTDDRLSTSGTPLASAEYDYHYDAAGRLDKSLSTIAGLTKEIQQTHTRDPLGRRTGLAVDLVTGFDSSDWSVDTTVAEHANAYTFDHLGQLTRVTQSGGVSGNAGVAAKRVDLEYDAAGRITKIKRRDGLTDGATIVAETTNTYGTSFLSASLLKIETTNSSSQVIARETYQYLDPFFRVSTHKTGVGAAEHTTTYQYDTTGQLISVDDDATTGVEESFVWDLNGNRKNKTDRVATGNQLTADETRQYVYDEEGNLEEARSLGSNSVLLTAYSYDHRQRLVLVTIKDPTGATTTKTVEYAYDTFNRLVSKKVTDYSAGSPQTPIVQYFVHDEETKSSGGSMSPSPLAGEGQGEGARGDVILEFLDTDGAGGNAPTVAKRFLWSTAVDQLFAQEDLLQGLADTDRYLWLLQDKLGTVRTALNRDGTVNALLNYDSFGRLTSITDANGQTLSVPPTYFGYTAQFYDVDTGLVWFSDGTGRGRWFSPVLQRFINRDEPMLRDGPNPYAYVDNSPTNATDPSGQNAEEWLKKLPRQYQNFFSFEQRLALEFGYYSAQLKLERDYLLARAQYLRKAIERLQPYASSCGPGTRGGNMIAGMKQELTDIQSRFAENVAESSELEELFNSLDLNSVDFNFRIPHNDDLEESHFGKGLTGARNLALAFMRGWTGQSGGLQPSMGPEEGLLALYSGIKGLAALAGRSFTLGGVTATFSKGLSNNVRSFFRSFRQGADEAAEAATRNTPCPPRGSNPGVIKNNPANKKIETGVPRTNGGWVKRWIRMSDDDYARWREERFDYYNRVVDLSRRLRLTPEEATRFRFNQMQKWRENWLRDFLESRTY